MYIDIGFEDMLLFILMLSTILTYFVNQKLTIILNKYGIMRKNSKRMYTVEDIIE